MQKKQTLQGANITEHVTDCRIDQASSWLTKSTKLTETRHNAGHCCLDYPVSIYTKDTYTLHLLQSCFEQVQMKTLYLVLVDMYMSKHRQTMLNASVGFIEARHKQKRFYCKVSHLEPASFSIFHKQCLEHTRGRKS